MKKLMQGYMLVFSLMMIALAMIMITSVVNKARVHVATMQILIDREKARLLALSGLEIAKCRLANPVAEEQKEKEKPVAGGTQEQKQGGAPDATQEGKKLLGYLLPNAGQFQRYTVAEHGKSVYGTIDVCIGCEQGKLNINQLYDFATHSFKDEKDQKKSAKILMETIFAGIEKAVGGKNLLEKFTEYLKKRDYPLNDPTELLEIKEFAEIFKDSIFYEPINPKEKKETTSITSRVEGAEAKGRSSLYLDDIFTIWTKDATLEPWLLSTSMTSLLSLNQIVGKEDAVFKEAIEKFSPAVTWSSAWNERLKPLYGKDFGALLLPLQSLLSAKFEPMIFSVVSYGSVKKTTQKLYAILERKKSSKADGPLYEIIVKRLYWI